MLLCQAHDNIGVRNDEGHRKVRTAAFNALIKLIRCTQSQPKYFEAGKEYQRILLYLP
jgi:hypothetical protein